MVAKYTLNMDRLFRAFLNNNPTGVVNSKFVKVTSSKMMKTDKGRVLMTRTAEPGNPNIRVYSQEVRTPPGYAGRISQAPYLYLSCGCADFMFRWQYVLAKLGSADPPSVNEPPIKTNPAMKVSICKHLAKAMILVKKKEQSVK